MKICMQELVEQQCGSPLYQALLKATIQHSTITTNHCPCRNSRLQRWHRGCDESGFYFLWKIVLPLVDVVGQDAIKTTFLLGAIDREIGGIAICGKRGTAKTVMALELLHCRFCNVILKEIASLIEIGAYAREIQRIVRAFRLTMSSRRKLKSSIVSPFLIFALAPESEPHVCLCSYPPKHPGFSSTSYELTGDFAEIKENLLALHQISTLRRDELGQLSYQAGNTSQSAATQLPPLQFVRSSREAEVQSSTIGSSLKPAVPPSANRTSISFVWQFCRYLFYLGKIRTIQLE
ncbi:Probable 26S proteasome non-ATPase regulatory subunit 3 [Linum perenne]